MKKLTIIEKLICLILAGLIISIPLYPYIKTWALEFHADKNAAFNFTAPLINATNTSLFAVGANNTVVYVNSNDGTTFTAANTNITRVDAGGIYLFQLNATEMNHDLIGVYYNGTGCLQQYFAINTKLKEGIDLNTANIASVNSTTNSTTFGNSAIKTLLNLVDSNTTSIPAIKAQTDKITFDASNRTIANTTINMDKSNYTINGTLAF